VTVCLHCFSPLFELLLPEVDGFFVQQSGLGVVAGDAGEGVGEGGEGGGRRVACRGKDLLQVSFFLSFYRFFASCTQCLGSGSVVWFLGFRVRVCEWIGGGLDGCVAQFSKLIMFMRPI
jgi:hypothetical protein